MERELAKVLVEELREISDQSINRLATKEDLRNEIKLVRHEIKIAMLTTIISMGVMMITSIVVINWLSKAVTGH